MNKAASRYLHWVFLQVLGAAQPLHEKPLGEGNERLAPSRWAVAGNKPAQALRYLLWAFPHLKRGVFQVQATPLSFGFLLAQSPQGREALTQMLEVHHHDQRMRLASTPQAAEQASRQRDEAARMQGSFRASHLPREIQGLLPAAILETDAPLSRLAAPGMSINALAEQTLPYWQDNLHPAAGGLRILSSMLRSRRVPGLDESSPALAGIEPAGMSDQDIALYQVRLPGIHTHAGFAGPEKELLDRILPELPLSDITDYSQARESNRRQLQAREKALRESSRQGVYTAEQAAQLGDQLSPDLLKQARQAVAVVQAHLDRQRLVAPLARPETSRTRRA